MSNLQIVKAVAEEDAFLSSTVIVDLSNSLHYVQFVLGLKSQCSSG